MRLHIHVIKRPSNFGLMPKCTQSSRKIKNCYKSAAVTQYLVKRENHPLLTARWIFEMINVSAVCPNFWSVFNFFVVLVSMPVHYLFEPNVNQVQSVIPVVSPLIPEIWKHNPSVQVTHKKKSIVTNPPGLQVSAKMGFCLFLNNSGFIRSEPYRMRSEEQNTTQEQTADRSEAGDEGGKSGNKNTDDTTTACVLCVTVVHFFQVLISLIVWELAEKLQPTTPCIENNIRPH